MPIKDLRSFLKEYESSFPEDVIHIDKPISCKYEISAIVFAFEKKNTFPLLIFHQPINVKGDASKFPAIVN